MKYNKILNVMLLGAMCFGFVACEKEEPSKPIYTVTLSVNDETMGTVAGAGTYENGESATLTATANEGYAFYAWSDGSTENPKTVTVETTLEATFYAFYNGHHYVDLGLPSGLLWAVCNVGAEKMEAFGDYFAWGETESKENYDWNTLKYWDNVGATKYSHDDNLVTLEAEDDAATANWGGAWRTPKRAEQDELRTECTWTKTTKNGKAGFEVKGKNGNSIFLPAAGSRNGSGFYGVGLYGYYWSSTVDKSYPDYSFYIGFDESCNWYYTIRCYGQSVRAVFSKE